MQVNNSLIEILEVFTQEIVVIKCHLSKILGEHRVKMSDVISQTGISRGTITRLYYEQATRIDFEVAEKLCRYLKCGIGELLECIEGENSATAEKN